MNECSSHRRMISSSYIKTPFLASDGTLSVVFYLLELLEEYKK